METAVILCNIKRRILSCRKQLSNTSIFKEIHASQHQKYRLRSLVIIVIASQYPPFVCVRVWLFRQRRLGRHWLLLWNALHLRKRYCFTHLKGFIRDRRVKTFCIIFHPQTLDTELHYMYFDEIITIVKTQTQEPGEGAIAPPPTFESWREAKALFRLLQVLVAETCQCFSWASALEGQKANASPGIKMMTSYAVPL